MPPPMWVFWQKQIRNSALELLLWRSLDANWQKKKPPTRSGVNGRKRYLCKKTTEFVRGLVIYQAAIFAAVLPFGPFFRALASSSFLLASYQTSNSLKLFNAQISGEALRP